MTFNSSRLQSLAKPSMPIWGLARAVQMLETTTSNTGLAQVTRSALSSDFVRFCNWWQRFESKRTWRISHHITRPSTSGLKWPGHVLSPKDPGAGGGGNTISNGLLKLQRIPRHPKTSQDRSLLGSLGDSTQFGSRWQRETHRKQPGETRRMWGSLSVDTAYVCMYIYIYVYTYIYICIVA